MNSVKWFIIALLIAFAVTHFLRPHRTKSAWQAANPSTPMRAATSASTEPLAWPLDCYKGESCLVNFNYPDIRKDGRDFNCDAATLPGHEGTDIGVTQEAMDKGVKVYAAADGVVQWMFDGSYDRCPSDNQDCRTPTQPMGPNVHDGYMVCTPSGPYCRNGQGSCYWCFYGANVVVILHDSAKGIFATRYDHLRNGSIQVRPGQKVSKGQVIGLVGSAGRSTGPHLHFEIWKSTFYDPYDPWAGQCNAGDRQLWPYPAGGPAR